jgi:hypothetical protein
VGWGEGVSWVGYVGKSIKEVGECFESWEKDSTLYPKMIMGKAVGKKGVISYAHYPYPFPTPILKRFGKGFQMSAIC